MRRVVSGPRRPPRTLNRGIVSAIRDYLFEHGPSPAGDIVLALDARGFAPIQVYRNLCSAKHQGRIDRRDGLYALAGDFDPDPDDSERAEIEARRAAVLAAKRTKRARHEPEDLTDAELDRILAPFEMEVCA